MKNMVKIKNECKDVGRTQLLRGETIFKDLFIKVTSDGRRTICIKRDVVVVIEGFSGC